MQTLVWSIWAQIFEFLKFKSRQTISNFVVETWYVGRAECEIANDASPHERSHKPINEGDWRAPFIDDVHSALVIIVDHDVLSLTIDYPITKSQFWKCVVNTRAAKKYILFLQRTPNKFHWYGWRGITFNASTTSAFLNQAPLLAILMGLIALTSEA